MVSVTTAWRDGHLEKTSTRIRVTRGGMGWWVAQSLWRVVAEPQAPSLVPTPKKRTDCSLERLVWKESKWVRQSQQKAGARYRAGRRWKGRWKAAGWMWDLRPCSSPASSIQNYLLPCPLPTPWAGDCKVLLWRKGRAPRTWIPDTGDTNAGLRTETWTEAPPKGWSEKEVELIAVGNWTGGSVCKCKEQELH